MAKPELNGDVMPMNFENLDMATRIQMLEELAYSVSRNELYMSERLNAAGRLGYPELLKETIECSDEQALAANLQRRGYIMVGSPINAHTMLAEGEFNRFYVRALCKRAINEDKRLQVYRAKPVAQPRPESQARIGSIVDAEALLADLRTHTGAGSSVETALGIPGGPNSGISVRLID